MTRWKRILSLLLCCLLLPVFGRAEEAAVQVTVSFRGSGREDIHYETAGNDLAGLIREAIAKAEKTDIPENIRASATMVNPMEVTLDGERYAVFFNRLYTKTWLEKEGQCFSLRDDFGASLSYPAYLWLDRDLPDFSVDAAWEELLKPYGWTPFFTLSDAEIRLPAQLTASAADESDLYFTWAQLFCQDAGFDLKPYLGKTVRAAVLGLWETMERGRFFAADLENGIHVPVNQRCVILHDGDAVIGAFIAPGRHDGSWMASLTGHTALDLLGTDDPTEYLLSRAVLTEEEKENAHKTKEEIMALYLAAGPGESTGLDLRADILRGLNINMNDDALFRTRWERWEQQLEWMRQDGIAPRQPGAAVKIHPAYEDAEDEFVAEMDDGNLMRIGVAWESDETGWKIIYCDQY